jgi:hypothetical protein
VLRSGKPGTGPVHLTTTDPLRFTNDMSTLTTRQQPVAAQFEIQLDMLAAVAAAIADNAFEDGEGIDPATAWAWLGRLEQIKNQVVISMTIAKSRGA